MFSELFLFAKKMKFLTIGEFHCIFKSYLGPFILCAYHRFLEGTILNQPYRQRVSVGQLIATKASWPHLSIVSPALHPPERPSHTHTPKNGFRREMRSLRVEGTLSDRVTHDDLLE